MLVLSISLSNGWKEGNKPKFPIRTLYRIECLESCLGGYPHRSDSGVKFLLLSERIHNECNCNIKSIMASRKIYTILLLRGANGRLFSSNVLGRYPSRLATRKAPVCMIWNSCIPRRSPQLIPIMVLRNQSFMTTC